MKSIIGIRREDKNEWERRSPLTPNAVKELREKYGIKTIVQPSPIRVFTNEEYEKAGAEINENLWLTSSWLSKKSPSTSSKKIKPTHSFPTPSKDKSTICPCSKK